MDKIHYRFEASHRALDDLGLRLRALAANVKADLTIGAIRINAVESETGFSAEANCDLRINLSGLGKVLHDSEPKPVKAKA